MPPLTHKPAPLPPRPKSPPPPSYWLTEADMANAMAANQMLALAKLMRGKSEHAYYRAAGQHLARLHHNHSNEWAELLRRECNLSPRRAAELMSLAKLSGPAVKDAFLEFRKADAERHKKARRSKAKLRGEGAGKAQKHPK